MPPATMPTRSGYTFGGYYSGTSGTGTQYYTSTGASARLWNIAGNTTLYADWSGLPKVTISYDGRLRDSWWYLRPGENWPANQKEILIKTYNKGYELGNLPTMGQDLD